MSLFDMPIEDLKTYLPDRNEPSDFDAFWQATLADARLHALDTVYVPVDYGLKTIDAFDVTFSGFGGQRIKGWLLLPKHREEPLPCVVEYIGYGGGRGFPQDWLQWSASGYAHFVMDTRGQGSVWQNGDTPDNAAEGQNPQVPGFMTRGIQSKESYYYRRLMTDAVRAVEAAKSHAAVDSSCVALCGKSQGGGVSLAVAGLVPNLVAVMPEVPFLCHFSRAITLEDRLPYSEIIKYLKIHRGEADNVRQTLSYFDGMNFASRATAPTLFSVALMDKTCPSSTVYAAYNHYQADKQIKVYEFNDHEGGQTFHHLKKVKFLNGIIDNA